MKKQHCESNLGPFLLDYWRAQRPDFFSQLERHGNLYSHADDIAGKAAEYFERAHQNGVRSEFAYDFAARVWENPSERRKPADSESRTKAHRTGQS